MSDADILSWAVALSGGALSALAVWAILQEDKY